MATIGLLAALVAGCQTKPVISAPEGAAPRYQASNAYADPRGIAVRVTRVAVLPLVTSTELAPSTVDTLSLQSILTQELRKSERFEIVTISPKLLRDRTGRSDWRSTDSLPVNFLEIIHEETGADVVLFSELTDFKPYGEVVLGWKCQLVTLDIGRIIWVFDEVFDGAEKEAQLAANQYLRDRRSGVLWTDEAGFWRQSPRNFAQFSLHSMVATIPEP